MPKSKDKLTDTEVHDVLSNERRRMALEILRRNGDKMSLRELSEQIAEIETGEDPPPRNVRQSVYVSLHQTHLPKLDKLSIVDYDSASKAITLQDSVDQVAVYMDRIPTRSPTWSEFYVGVAITGMLTLSAWGVGVPVISTIPSWVIGSVFLLLVCVSGLFQTYQ